MGEQVLVVRRADLFPAGAVVPSGLSPGDGTRFLERIARHGFFTPRDAAETDPSLKQVIPYGVLTCGSQVFLLRRTRRGGESRLHDLYTLGVGGHINPTDEDPSQRGDRGVDPSVVEAAFHREMAEELCVDTPFHLELVGVLNDDSNSVGRVHFGVVYRLGLETPRVHVRERDELEGRFQETADLGAYRSRMETWSRYVCDHLLSPNAGEGLPP